MRLVLLLALLLVHPGTSRAHDVVPGAPFGNIYNGVATRGFPAVVGVGIINDDGSLAICSGTLIAPRVVMTAAHCLVGAVAAIAAVFPEGGTRTDYEAAGFAIHPKYTLRHLTANDVALMILETPVANVAPLPLAQHAPRAGKTVTIVGYGDDGLSGAGRKRVGEVRLKRCPRSVRVTGGSVRLKRLLCWRPRVETSDTCSGDSGGPLLADGTVAGVHSGGIGTGSCPTQLSFDTNVARYRPWIDGVLRQQSAQ